MQHAVLIQQHQNIPSGNSADQQFSYPMQPIQPIHNIAGQAVLPTMHIRLMGTFVLTFDRTINISIDVQRLQSLLAYLALHCDVPLSRTRLASLLWPDSTESQAHTNLRNLIYRLRKALPDVDRVLYVNRNTILWRDDNSWTLDVIDFERAVVRAEQAEHMQDSTALHLALERALDLYRGELLPGCYDEWLLAERERLSQIFLSVLERLLHLLEKEGNYLGAIRVAQRLLHMDPLYERGYCHLMRLHAKSGNRAAVIRTYQACTTVLERELDVEPGPTTRRVYEQLVQSEQSGSYTTSKRSGSEYETQYALHS